MIRRSFLKLTSLASLGLNSNQFLSDKTHYLTLSFDDGFKKSCYKTAKIFENYGLKASMNIIASGHLESFSNEFKWMPKKLLGDFYDWNNLKSRGHEIMPHSWEHLNLTKIAIENAKNNIDKCLEYFNNNLDNFSQSDSIFNYPYNSSNEQTDEYLLKRVKAVRTAGRLVLKNKLSNEIPNKKTNLRLGTWGYGPDKSDVFVEESVNSFLKSNGGWLILTLHGLDNEGWGPLSSNYLDKLLNRLIKVNFLEIKTIGDVLI